MKTVHNKTSFTIRPSIRIFTIWRRWCPLASRSRLDAPRGIRRRDPARPRGIASPPTTATTTTMTRAREPVTGHHRHHRRRGRREATLLRRRSYTPLHPHQRNRTRARTTPGGVPAHRLTRSTPLRALSCTPAYCPSAGRRRFCRRNAPAAATLSRASSSVRTVVPVAVYTVSRCRCVARVQTVVVVFVRVYVTYFRRIATL